MGRKWTQDDVLAYKIKVVYQDLETFFGAKDLPSPDVEPEALTLQDSATANDKSTSNMLFQMSRITDPDNREPATIDFVRELFDVVHYADVTQKIKRDLMMRLNLRYLASQGKPPQVDVCIMDDFTDILLVVKVDRHKRGFDPEPRLISDVIAAFHNDNIMRANRLGTNPLASKVVPGIVMDGTMPTFYKIPGHR
jgi:hypothetical protein